MSVDTIRPPYKASTLFVAEIFATANQIPPRSPQTRSKPISSPLTYQKQTWYIDPCHHHEETQ